MDNTIVNGTNSINVTPDKKGQALTSFILGLVSIVAWFLPIIGAPVTIVGLVMGILGIKSSRKKRAIAGIILCSVFLVITVINAVMGAMMAISKMDEMIK